MESLKGMNERLFYQKLFLNDTDFEKWLVEMGLLYADRECECGSGMSLKAKIEHNYPIWRYFRYYTIMPCSIISLVS